MMTTHPTSANHPLASVTRIKVCSCSGDASRSSAACRNTWFDGIALSVEQLTTQHVEAGAGAIDMVEHAVVELVIVVGVRGVAQAVGQERGDSSVKPRRKCL